MPTSTLESIGYDWKKRAAQASGAPDEEIEQAFMQQSLSFVANKAGPLMQNPHRLGFEIVDKDDGNSRMCGIFAAHIAKDLFYAPCFFLNGEIKGTDLLYRCTPKKFVPLNEDWVKMLMERNQGDIGQGVEKGMRRKMPSMVEIQRLAYPPSSRGGGLGFKSAFTSTGAGEAFKAASMCEAIALDILTTKPQWDDWLAKAGHVEPLQPLLRDFILQDGGQRAVRKLASWIKRSSNFAENLLRYVPQDHWMPAELIEQTKSAALARLPKPGLILHTALGDAVKSASAEETFFKRGYYLEEKRPVDILSPIYETTPQAVESVAGPGIFDVIMFDGKRKKAICAPTSNQGVFDCGIGSAKCSAPCSIGSCGSSDWEFAQRANSSPKEMTVITEDGKYNTGFKIFGTCEKIPVDLWRDQDMMKETMSPGESYCIFMGGKSGGGAFSQPIHCLSKKESNGIVLYDVVAGPYGGSQITLKYNPDHADTELQDGILGQSARFVKIDAKLKKHDDAVTANPWYDLIPERAQVGDEDSLNTWIFTQRESAKKATVIYRRGAFTIRTGPKRNSRDLTKMSAEIALSRDLYISARNAEWLVDKAEEKGSFEFWFVPAASKAAAVTRVTDEPMFQELYDGAFNVPVQVPQSFALQTYTDQDPVPPPRIGDKLDPSMGNGGNQDSPEDDGTGLDMDSILNTPPDQLGQLAQSKNLEHVFDHGAVGSLTGTYDSISMIDKYLPKMEDALDAIGRSLFLFYWKPGDFQSAYGVDDMQNMENELLSNFKSFGDMVLNLLKKSRAMRRGSSFRGG